MSMSVLMHMCVRVCVWERKKYLVDGYRLFIVGHY